MNFEELMAYAKKTDCSDIHITVGTNLALRRYGTLEILPDCPTARVPQHDFCLSGSETGGVGHFGGGPGRRMYAS